MDDFTLCQLQAEDETKARAHVDREEKGGCQGLFMLWLGAHVEKLQFTALGKRHFHTTNSTLFSFRFPNRLPSTCTHFSFLPLYRGGGKGSRFHHSLIFLSREDHLKTELNYKLCSCQVFSNPATRHSD